MMGWMDGRKHRWELLWLGGWQWMDKAAKSLNWAFPSCCSQTTELLRYVVFLLYLAFSSTNIVEGHWALPSSDSDAVTTVAVTNHIEPEQVDNKHMLTLRPQKGTIQQLIKERRKISRDNELTINKKLMFPTFTTIFTSTWLSVWS